MNEQQLELSLNAVTFTNILKEANSPDDVIIGLIEHTPQLSVDELIAILHDLFISMGISYTDVKDGLIKAWQIVQAAKGAERKARLNSIATLVFVIFNIVKGLLPPGFRKAGEMVEDAYTKVKEARG
jgi:hypothetical protein